MKTSSLILMLCLLAIRLGAASDNLAQLSVLIKGLETRGGKVAVELLDEEEQRVREYWIPVVDATLMIEIDDLPAGNYALRFFHDENNNGQLDKNWVGIPTESFGFSNDAKVVFGEPSLSAMLFKLDGQTSITVNAKRL